MTKFRTKLLPGAAILAAMLSLSACQSAVSGLNPDDGGVLLASSRWGGHGSHLRKLDLTLEPGVPFGGCLVIESTRIGDAEAGAGLVC